MKNLVTYLLLFALLPFAGGCKRKTRPASPQEKIALTVRFFKSVEKRDSKAAVNQGKLIDRNHDMVHVQKLVSIQESNEAVGQAQKLLNQGKIKQALTVINNALKDYPENDVLKRSKSKLEELANARNYFNKMKNARNSSDVSDAIETIKLGLEQNMTPDLIAFLDACKEKEKQLIIAEREKSSSAVKNLNADIRKNIKLDARRAAQNKEETDLREKISERGEIMRKNAGPIPFDPSDKTSHYDLEKASADAEKIKAEDARREAEHLRLMQKRAEEIQEDNI